MHLELPSRRRGVDAFAQRDEREAERLQVLEQRDQVLQVASQPIELPRHQHVELAAPRVRHEPVERRPAVGRAAHAVIDGCLLAAGRDVAAQLGELVLGLLVEIGDAGVDGSSHGNLTGSGLP